MMFDKTELQFLNSITKYPSILNYHLLDKKENITKNLHPIATCGKPLFASEKIDGTNSRIILFPEKDGKRDFLIGSRENILESYFPDNLVCQYVLGSVERGIVDTITPIADKLLIYGFASPTDTICIWGEVYGGNISGWKNYAKSNDVFGFRVFDIAIYEPNLIKDLRTFKREQFRGWREKGNQPFLDIFYLLAVCKANSLNYVPLVELSKDIPTLIEETNMWLVAHIPETLVALDKEFDSSKSFVKSIRIPEGLVIRTADRKYIAKIRFEDYQKYARKKKEAK